MTTRTTREARAQLVGMLLIAAAGTAAYWIGQGASGGLQAGALLFGFALLVHLGRRRGGTLETMSGVGDERTLVFAVTWIGASAVYSRRG